MDHSLAFSQVDATPAHVIDIACTKAEKVAGGRIVDGGIPVEVSSTPGLDSDMMALLYQCHRMGKRDPFSVRLQMKFGPSRKRRHKRSDHGGQESQESGIGDILSPVEGSTESRFMGNWD